MKITWPFVRRSKYEETLAKLVCAQMDSRALHDEHLRLRVAVSSIRLIYRETTSSDTEKVRAIYSVARLADYP